MSVEIAVVAIAGATVTLHESIFNVRQKSFSRSRDATGMPFTRPRFVYCQRNPADVGPRRILFPNPRFVCEKISRNSMLIDEEYSFVRNRNNGFCFWINWHFRWDFVSVRVYGRINVRYDCLRHWFAVDLCRWIIIINFRWKFFTMWIIHSEQKGREFFYCSDFSKIKTRKTFFYDKSSFA